MAKPSRSKQPEFDPSELEDLIFTPAVGTGVGSHLLRPTAIPEVTTVVRPRTTTVVSPYQPTVVASVVTTVDVPELWCTESGDIVPSTRVRRIQTVHDVLGAAEVSVYETLWNHRDAVRGDGDAWRIVQLGYDGLVRHTRLSRKTIQRVVDRLFDKDFITIEVPADIYSRTSTTYRVFSERTALELQAAKGRCYSVKIGPGFVFVKKLQAATVAE